MCRTLLPFSCYFYKYLNFSKCQNKLGEVGSHFGTSNGEDEMGGVSFRFSITMLVLFVLKV